MAGARRIPDDVEGQSAVRRAGGSFSGYERDFVAMGGPSGRFVEISGVTGADSITDGRSAVHADFDNDGDLDILLVSRNSGQRTWNMRDQQLFQNLRGQDAGWVRVSLEGRKSGRDALGAVVRIKTSAGTLTRVRDAGGYLSSQADPRLLFGVGADRRTGPIEIRWPSGLVQTLPGVPARTSLRVVEGEVPEVIVDRAARLPLPAVEPRSDLARLGLSVGGPLPALALDDGTLAERLPAGRPALVVFWATWCSACKGLLPVVDRLRDGGLAVVAVSVDAPGEGDVARTLRDLGVRLDSARARPEDVARFGGGLATVPTAILLDERHLVTDAFVDWGAAAQERLATATKAWLGAPGPSAAVFGGPDTCGAAGESCASARDIPGGTFFRSNDGLRCPDRSHPATVSPFALDTFEVTVGRFREFVRAGGGTQARPPAAGDGANPRVPGSGWSPLWNTSLPATRAALGEALRCGADTGTWTDEPGDRERLPINCLTWYEAFAFCAWDGGRLPTEAEWGFAASGGDEQRTYPWSSPPNATAITQRHAVYSRPWVEAVGAHPLGSGRWGHADLAGNVWEWTLDAADGSALLPTEGADPCTPVGYPVPCDDCAQLGLGSARVLRGGGFGIPQQGLLAALRRGGDPGERHHVFGVRCARGPSTADAAVPGANTAGPPLACAPDCADRACGDDGCGGSCGACPGGASCDEPLGQCADPRYPPGPYGLTVGATLPRFAWVSQREQDAALATSPLAMAAEARKEGPGARPRALVLVFLSVSPGAREAVQAEGARWEALRERGAVVWIVLLDGKRRGQAADAYDVIDFARDTATPVPVLMDPTTGTRRVVRDEPLTVLVAPDTLRVEAIARGASPPDDDPLWASVERRLSPR